MDTVYLTRQYDWVGTNISNRLLLFFVISSNNLLDTASADDSWNRISKSHNCGLL